MANPNGNPNPNIAKLGEPYQFKSSPEHVEVSRQGGLVKNGVRRALRRLACHTPGVDNPNANDMAKAFGKKKKSELTMAEIWALQKSVQAMQNFKAMDTLIDHVDGKQVEKKVEANVGSIVDIVAAADQLERMEGDGDGSDNQPDEEGR